MEAATFVHLFCRRGSLAGKSLAYLEPAPLPMPRTVRLGRAADTHLAFRGPDEQGVAGLHAELRFDGTAVQLDDLSGGPGLILTTQERQERIEHLTLHRGMQAEVRLGAGGPLCTISVGLAVPLGHYWVTAKLGEGGMGEVYLGWDVRLERFVVLKLLRPDASHPAADHHLFDEARIVSQLENHHVVRIYELGPLGRIPYLAMEYLRGVSVNHILRALHGKGQRLPAAVAAGLMRQVCLGLHAAHELPTAVVHRDVSGNNIIVTRQSVKVIDFGLARAKNRVSKSFTEGDRIAGCPPYMSPEQIQTPRAVDRRSDLFSAAVVLYELCTGQGLFHRENLTATMLAVLAHEPPPLRQVCPDASIELEQLVARALAKDPADRPSTAAELAAGLRHAAGPQLGTHECIVEYLERIGIELHGVAPKPLSDEPELVRQARLATTRSPPWPSAPAAEPEEAWADAAPMPEADGPELTPLPVPAGGACVELSSPRVSRLRVTSLELDGNAARRPLALPLELDGIISGCSHPLRVALANRLVELRVAPEALAAGRRVRIYPSLLTSDNARSSYAIPESCSAQRLFVGHHRDPPLLLTVASSAHHPDGSPPSLPLPELGVRLQPGRGPRRVVAIYRTDPAHAAGQLVCICI